MAQCVRIGGGVGGVWCGRLIGKNEYVIISVSEAAHLGAVRSDQQICPKCRSTIVDALYALAGDDVSKLPMWQKTTVLAPLPIKNMPPSVEKRSATKRA